MNSYKKKNFKPLKPVDGISLKIKFMWVEELKEKRIIWFVGTIFIFVSSFTIITSLTEKRLDIF